jgi:F0F1-type ATP synthase epsilon subunit
MNRVYKFLIGLALIFSFIGATNPSLINKYYTAAIVTKVIQDVKHKSVESPWIETKPLTQLKTNDMLNTGKRSVAVLKFVDGSIVRVRENSTIMILAEKKDRGLVKNTKLENGKIVFDVTKQIDDDRFIITTPTAVATIRGTSGLVELLQDGSTLLTVEFGVVEVESLGEKKETISVEAGITSIINSDGTITTNESTEEQRKNFQSSNKTNERFIQIQTNRGNFKVYYLDSE